MPGPPPPDCSYLEALFTEENINASAPGAEPNPDIAGVGVVTGFVGSAYITLLLLIAHYLLGSEPDKSRLATLPGPPEREPKPNPIDRGILRYVRRAAPRAGKWDGLIKARRRFPSGSAS
ncbi:hypothetical protein FGG08_006358 [Glutinoglossum americanum]|uniref:Uncharacterized protein n=1 Tax=Glutinoglossum americanum TaxID=1670608 RepID=A0A9P8KXJ9_9PEZI|nr:hypothetical protein FGG08_006358 [Glutinoglossum americanum]